jgi:hypothetical protein
MRNGAAKDKRANITKWFLAACLFVTPIPHPALRATFSRGEKGSHQCFAALYGSFTSGMVANSTLYSAPSFFSTLRT